MVKEFKRSLWGYSPSGIRALAVKMDQEQMNTLTDLKKQLADEVRQIGLLRAEIQGLSQEVDRYRSLENEVSRLLLKAHLGATEKAYTALKDYGRLEREAMERVIHRRAELSDLRETMERVRSELSSIVAEYLSVEEKAEGV